MGIRDGKSTKTYATALVDGDRSKASASATKADVSGEKALSSKTSASASKPDISGERTPSSKISGKPAELGEKKAPKSADKKSILEKLEDLTLRSEERSFPPLQNKEPITLPEGATPDGIPMKSGKSDTLSAKVLRKGRKGPSWADMVLDGDCSDFSSDVEMKSQDEYQEVKSKKSNKKNKNITKNK
jgi:hypothetical protein